MHAGGVRGAEKETALQGHHQVATEIAKIAKNPGSGASGSGGKGGRELSSLDEENIARARCRAPIILGKERKGELIEITQSC